MAQETYICGYKILIADSILDLEELVSDEFGHGWQPLGGMQPVRKSDSSQKFTQTLVQFCER